jgi:hypothetical protein
MYPIAMNIHILKFQFVAVQSDRRVLCFRAEAGGKMFLRKVYTTYRLHGVIIQNTAVQTYICICIAVPTTAK